MGPTKRLIILGAAIAMLSHLFLFKVGQVYAEDEYTYFVTTAYYSPLPGQTRYTTGSYEGDVRLNGEGVTTASGKGVFPGLLAGPKNYPFGTKIYFEGYGIGSIEDRGGAIVKAGERGHSYDRIDIWMGYGDAGLERALSWGTRTIKAKIVVPSSEVSLQFGEDSSIGYISQNLEVNPETPNEDDVKNLQTLFSNADLYLDTIDGNYNSIKDELIKFQLDNNIIESEDEEGAGWYGPKTYAALREKYGIENEVILVEEDPKLFSQYNHKVASEIYKIILKYGDISVDPDSDPGDIQKLQMLLTHLGEYTGVIDGKYSSIESTLINYQIKIGVISTKTSSSAGLFGPKTKTAMWNYYEEHNNDTVIKKLSSNDEANLNAALSTIQNVLEKRAKKNGTSYDEEFSKFSSQIDQALAQIKDMNIKLKLIYLQEIM